MVVFENSLLHFVCLDFWRKNKVFVMERVCEEFLVVKGKYLLCKIVQKGLLN